MSLGVFGSTSRDPGAGQGAWPCGLEFCHHPDFCQHLYILSLSLSQPICPGCTLLSDTESRFTFQRFSPQNAQQVPMCSVSQAPTGHPHSHPHPGRDAPARPSMPWSSTLTLVDYTWLCHPGGGGSKEVGVPQTLSTTASKEKQKDDGIQIRVPRWAPAPTPASALGKAWLAIPGPRL